MVLAVSWSQKMGEKSHLHVCRLFGKMICLPKVSYSPPGWGIIFWKILHWYSRRGYSGRSKAGLGLMSCWHPRGQRTKNRGDGDQYAKSVKYDAAHRRTTFKPKRFPEKKSNRQLPERNASRFFLQILKI